MDGKVNNDESLMGHIQQLERERDELRKDIEQLCLQQAGPSYLVVATRMHFQSWLGAGDRELEKEVNCLYKREPKSSRGAFRSISYQSEVLASLFASIVYFLPSSHLMCVRCCLQSQLADLHNAEVSKNMEAEKQVKYFQGSVAAAFAERDHSLMEAEKAREREDLMSQKLNDLQKRAEELTSDFLEEKKLDAKLQIDLVKLEEQNEKFKKVVNKFYEIRQSALKGSEDRNWADKCACLLQDPVELWSFDDCRETSTSKYIGALEEELENLRKSVDNLQNKLQMGLEIEDHLKKKVCELGKKKILSVDMIKTRISELHHIHTQNRYEIANLLEEGKAQFRSMLDVVEEMIRQLHVSRSQNFVPLQRDEKFDDIECRDVHISDADPCAVAERNGPSLPNIGADGAAEMSDALVQALQEKVGALLLLSQQEERHLLERNVNAALQKKLEELQRNLLQVTNEKVKALMELARLKQECQLLQVHGIKQGNFWADIGDKSIAARERDGKLKSLLKKTYLSRWISTSDLSGNEADIHPNNQENFSSKSSNYSMAFARMKIDNATFKESMESMEHLTSSIHRLRLSLLKAKESITSQGPASYTTQVLNDIIAEAKLVKTALGGSLPVSWSAEVDVGSSGGDLMDEPSDGCGDSSSHKVDSVSAAGFEMVELLILAAQILKEDTTNGT